MSVHHVRKAGEEAERKVNLPGPCWWKSEREAESRELRMQLLVGHRPSMGKVLGSVSKTVENEAW